MMQRLLAAILAVLLPAVPAPHSQDPQRQEPAAASDGRAATVTDRQGLAFVRAAGHQRWTPLRPRAVLLPGDTVRTEARGANALELQLAAGGTCVLGPGSLLELTAAAKLRLLRGELEVAPAAG